LPRHRMPKRSSERTGQWLVPPPMSMLCGRASKNLFDEPKGELGERERVGQEMGITTFLARACWQHDGRPWPHHQPPVTAISRINASGDLVGCRPGRQVRITRRATPHSHDIRIPEGGPLWSCACHGKRQPLSAAAAILAAGLDASRQKGGSPARRLDSTVYGRWTNTP